MSNPVLPGAALALPEEVVAPSVAGQVVVEEGLLLDDAVAFAPEIEDEDAADGVAAVPEEALPAVVPATVETQLANAGIDQKLIARIVQAANEFGATVGDGRTIDSLTLGLLWKSEGGAQLTMTLDPTDGVFIATHGDAVEQLKALIDFGAFPDMLRAWRIANIGVWGFGLDDIFPQPPTGAADAILHYNYETARAGWATELARHGNWTRSIPFEHVRGAARPATISDVEPVELSIQAGEAVGFLITVAARFTRQLWLLEAELAARGLRIEVAATANIPVVEPVLAYLCYLHRAPKAAAVWQGLVFLRELCADAYVARPTSGGHYELSVLIGTLNRWLELLRDPAALGLSATLVELVKDSTAKHPNGRLARHILTEVAERAEWMPIIPTVAELDASGQLLLEELVDGWTAFAVQMVEGLHNPVPGELLFLGTHDVDDDNNEIVEPGRPPLFPSQMGTTGFGARNYGTRFKKATGQALGASVRYSPLPG
jgi:hypothetical protein